MENQLQMAEDDVTQVNDLFSMLQDSKEVYIHMYAESNIAFLCIINEPH